MRTLNLNLTAKLFVAAALSLSLFAPGLAQDQAEDQVPDKTIEKEEFEMGFGAGLGVGIPGGIKIEAGATFIPELSVRAGVDFFPSIEVYKGERTFNVDAGGYTIPLLAQYNAKAGAMGGHLLLDYHPARSGFRITAGLYFGGLNAALHGLLLENSTGTPILEYARGAAGLLDPKYQSFVNDPSFDYTLKDAGGGAIEGGDLTVRMADDSSFDADVAFKSAVKPYLGIGYGYIAPKSRVGFSFDLGVFYAGGLKLASPNITKGDPNAAIIYVESHPDYSAYYGLTKFIPVLNIGINIRLN